MLQPELALLEPYAISPFLAMVTTFRPSHLLRGEGRFLQPRKITGRWPAARFVTCHVRAEAVGRSAADNERVQGQARMCLIRGTRWVIQGKAG
ncbi:hypothetical protein BS50DRAFT_9944 [Corynespora cassiicola Philippines]|uniref:Uncharacterized protein n=1 Tax=Corynespora cassiicola Philippines TaxID=1448308 RepID=A0A2T2P967_CORCC|nr:hypothetical protein BS50DRAFT_9944 [Corynespora cassiicola Philippines]